MKHPGNLEHHEKTKPGNNRSRRVRGTPGQRHRKYTQQNYRGKLSQPKEEYHYESARSLQNTKQTGSKKSTHHIIIKAQNIQNKESILRAAKEKDQVTYKGKTIRITPDF